MASSRPREPPIPTGLPVMKPGNFLAAQGFVFVEHPEHVLGAGHDVRGRNIDVGTELVGELPDPAPAEPLLLAQS